MSLLFMIFLITFAWSFILIGSKQLSSAQRSPFQTAPLLCYCWRSKLKGSSNQGKKLLESGPCPDELKGYLACYGAGLDWSPVSSKGLQNGQ